MVPHSVPTNKGPMIAAAAVLAFGFVLAFRTCAPSPGPPSAGDKDVPKILQQKAQEGRAELEAKVRDLEGQLEDLSLQLEMEERKLKRVRTVEFVPASEFLDVQYLHRPLFDAPHSVLPYDLLGGAD